MAITTVSNPPKIDEGVFRKKKNVSSSTSHQEGISPAGRESIDIKWITWEELGKHDSPDDCWIAVRNKVYDVTSWVPKHPGGQDTIAMNGGRDATQIFESYHPFRTYGTLKKYYIGEIESDFDHPSFPPMSDFYKTMKKKVEAYFIDKKLNPRHAPELIVRVALSMLIIAILHLFCLSEYCTSFTTFVIASVIMGFFSGYTTFIAVHEGSHASTTNSPLFWRLFGVIGADFVNGASFFNWLHQHFLGHHPYTNLTSEAHPNGEDCFDPDVLTHDPDFRRIKPNQAYFSHYKWQNIYMPLLYGFLMIKIRINDIKIVFFSKMNGRVKLSPIPRWHLIAFILGKSFWLSYKIIIPAFYFPIWKVLLSSLISDLVTGYTLALVFQVNHVMPNVSWPKIDSKTGYVNMDWAEMQVKTTIDYAHGNYWTTFWTGGLNYQVTHHLFPYIAQTYYIEIGKIVTQHCKEYGIDYIVLPSYWSALNEHIKHLTQMGTIDTDF